MLCAASLALALLGSVPTPAGEPAIDWFKGDVQAAFDRAKKDGKPLFLYWGAVWCPPCNQIKKTIFTRREFIEKTRLFVPVYLDGDTESAQTWGEKLGASGYPTMIVYSSAGKEILRLPTGLQVEEFTTVLDQALERMTPVKDLLEATLGAADPGKVPDASWRILAHHSWGQDTLVNFSPEEREKKMRALEAAVPARLRKERARLFTHWLGAAVELLQGAARDKPAAFQLDEAERARADARLREILDSPELSIATLEFLILGAGDAVKALHPEPGGNRDRLIAVWARTMDRIERDPALSVDERLSSIVPAIEFWKIEAGEKAKPPAEFQARVKKLVEWADANAKDAYTRQSAMNTASQLLEEVGLKEEAKKLLLAELDKAVSPHYFMSGLASLAREAGNKDEAIEWMKKAYDTAKGRATRFQWGSAYLSGLIDLKPEAGEEIRRESERVMKELLAYDDAFAGRNKARFKRLQKKYSEWNAKGAHAAEIASLKSSLAPGCAALSDRVEAADAAGAESPRARCTSFFGQLGVN